MIDRPLTIPSAAWGGGQTLPQNHDGAMAGLASPLGSANDLNLDYI